MTLPGLVRWYGGKGQLRPRLLPLIPRTRVYCEHYGGAASILMARKVAPVEVYNDLHGELVNLMRVMQNRAAARELYRRLKWTAYSYAEFRRARRVGPDADPVERAWAFWTRQNQGFGGIANTDGNWSRVFVETRGDAMAVSTWLSRLRKFRAMCDRIRHVQVDQRDALESISYWDSPDTTHYLDPPYVAETRVKGHRAVYDHECTDAHHAALVALLPTLTGAVVLSGYASAGYDALGWERIDIETACYAASKARGTKLRGAGNALTHAARVECVWRNPRAVELAGGGKMLWLE